MGCDIHIHGEIKEDGKWMPIPSDGRKTSWGTFYERDSEFLAPFDWRSYALFGFLADVRNYSHSECITGETRGLPTDSEYLNSISKYAYKTNPMNGDPIPESEQETIKSEIIENYNYHSHSYITLAELLAWDYDKTFWDRRISRTEITPSGGSVTNGACLAEEGEGEIITYREHLGESFFEELDKLKKIGDPENIRVVFWFDN